MGLSSTGGTYCNTVRKREEGRKKEDGGTRGGCGGKGVDLLDHAVGAWAVVGTGVVMERCLRAAVTCDPHEP